MERGGIDMEIETIIEKAKMDISGAVMGVKESTGLPMYMIELIVAGILGDIRDSVAREAAVKKIKEKAKQSKEKGDEEQDGKL